ncbi:putative uncharacterized protein [Prevotella sp. CAG:487]|nr:putative uncharacterized protein [Prevotella sp. CAG:487]
MKKLLIVCASLLFTLGAAAVPAKRGIWKTIRLADGTEVKAELRGDEFMNYWESADGRRFTMNSATKRFETADFDALRKSAAAKRAVRKASRPAYAQGGPSNVTLGGDHPPYVGEKKGLVILVEFADMPFRDGHDVALYNRILNEDNFSNDMGFIGSVRDYFRDQSYGQFLLSFDIAGPVRMPEGYAHYGTNDNANIGEMLETALLAVDNDIDFTKYDWDGDGEVDQVFFLYAGRGEASGGDEGTIWPHEWQLLGALGRYMTLDGMRINTYACGCEMASATRIDGIGTICHEFSHCLGLADMYDTDYSGGYGMSTWDIMDQGNYNGNSYIPAGYTAWERAFAGWLEPEELTEATSVDDMAPLSDGGKAYLIRNDGHSDEYYLLENRSQTGWDAGLAASGLLVVHVDFDENVWARNKVNDDPNRMRCTPVVADGLRGIRNIAGDVFPYNSNNSLTNTSRPAAEVYNKNTDGSYLMNKDITGITRNSDGTISFNFAPSVSSILLYESFDGCNGKGGNDGVFNNIGANKNVGTGTMSTDTDGWIYTKAGGANQCAMFTGAATTPEFELNGMARLTFKAAPLTTGANASQLTLSANGNATLSKTDYTMSIGKMTEYTLAVEGTGKVSVTFTPGNIFFLDEVKIESVTTSGIEGVTAGEAGSVSGKPADNRIYSIDGRYVGTDTGALKEGIYIRNGKKFVK